MPEDEYPVPLKDNAVDPYHQKIEEYGIEEPILVRDLREYIKLKNALQTLLGSSLPLRTLLDALEGECNWLRLSKSL